MGGLSIKPIACNAGCLSCYERQIFNAGRGDSDYDLDAAIEALKKTNEKCAPSIHGGEPLMMGKEKCEKLFRFCFDKWGGSGIQTNALLIDQDFIRLFIKYKVTIGVSIDGDTADLNRGRWNYAPVAAGAEKGTAKVVDTLKLLSDYRVHTSIISLLRQYNAGPGRLDDFLAFLLRMEKDAGVSDIRTNPVVVFDKMASPDEELTPEQLGQAFCRISDLAFQDYRRAWFPSRDFVDLLLGFSDATCNFTGCDPYHTTAEIPILSDGSLSSCMKPGLPREGIAGGRAEKRSNARGEALQQTECSGCRYWPLCQGGCPGEATDNDSRHKTRFCEAYKTAFDHVSSHLKGVLPNLNMQRDYNAQLDNGTIVQDLVGGSAWRQDKRKPVEPKTQQCTAGKPGGQGHGDKPHGDHTDKDRK